MYSQKLIGQLRIMKDFNIKPNYSELQREYGTDRHTIKKYYDNDGIPPRKTREHKSKWDPFLSEIEELISMPHVTYKSAYMYMFHTHGADKLPGDYDSMRNYLYLKGKRAKSQNKPHLLYETPPGKQSQFDWKEDLKMQFKGGTEITFNVFSLTLSYSREHIYIYSRGKGLDDFLSCFIKALNKIGGTSEEYLTDNMSAIVSLRGGEKKVNAKAIAFFKDIGAKLKLCKVKTPQTKGKDENANKFVSWIYPYNGKLESEADLIELIENTITSDANRQVNTGTGLPPLTLFSKEKEYLKPLASKILLESYLDDHIKQVVPPTQLIYYKGCKYSVGSEYISKEVSIYRVGETIQIYFESKLIAIHSISQEKINYDPKHYVEGLSRNMKHVNQDVIEKMAGENIERLKVLGKE